MAEADPVASTCLPNRQAVRRRIRRRSAMDALLVVAAAVALAVPATEPHDSLLVGMAAIGVGILFFMVRRQSDFAAIRATREAERRALEGRGISLAQWHAGAPLPRWPERMAGPAAPQEKRLAEPA